MDLVALKTRLLEELVPIRRDESECVMTAVPKSCFALAHLFQKSDPAKSQIRKKKRNFVSPFFSIILLLFFDQNANTTFFIEKRGLLIKRGVPKMTCFVIFGPFSKRLFFDQKAPFFDQKILPFSSTFSLLLIMVSVDHISFPSAGTGPLHIKGHETCASLPRQNLFLSFFRQSGTGPRPTHCGLQGTFEFCVQRADSTSHFGSSHLTQASSSLSQKG